VALLAVPFGLAIGLAVGTLGGGGSVLAIPVLVYVLGESVHQATTTSLLVVAAAALAGGVGHSQTGSICWRHAALIGPAAIVGVAAGTAANRVVGSGLLLGLFALVVLAAAGATWRGVDHDETARSRAPVDCPPLAAVRAASAGLLVGWLTGFFGVGGGFVVVPMLAIALHLSIRSAIGTSLVIVSGISTAGLAAHLLSGAELDPVVTGVMSGACAAGAAAGATLAPRASAQALGRGFAVLLGLVGLYILLATAVLGGPPHG
jgi:hypothetical protein